MSGEVKHPKWHKFWFNRALRRYSVLHESKKNRASMYERAKANGTMKDRINTLAKLKAVSWGEMLVRTRVYRRGHKLRYDNRTIKGYLNTAETMVRKKRKRTRRVA